MIFQDKLTTWAQGKASLTSQEVDFQREEAKMKKEILSLKGIIRITETRSEG